MPVDNARSRESVDAASPTAASVSAWTLLGSAFVFAAHRRVAAGAGRGSTPTFFAVLLAVIGALLLSNPQTTQSTPTSHFAAAAPVAIADASQSARLQTTVAAPAAVPLQPLEGEVRVSRAREIRAARARTAYIEHVLAQQAHLRAVARAHRQAVRLAAIRYRLERIRVLPIWRSFVIGEGFGVHGWHWGSGIHTGIDLDVPTGTPVHAVMAGTVVAAHWEGAYGNCIRIVHYDGAVTRYAHLSRISTHVGAYVRAGQYIGNVGSTGNTTGPHLHFELIVHGTPVNPRGWLR